MTAKELKDLLTDIEINVYTIKGYLEQHNQKTTLHNVSNELDKIGISAVEIKSLIDEKIITVEVNNGLQKHLKTV